MKYNIKTTIMDADIRGALNNLNKSYLCFEHKRKSLSKLQVKKILEYGVQKGYKYTSEITDIEISCVLNLCKCGGSFEYIEKEGYVCQDCGWTKLYLKLKI